ncbi:DUF3578 domain-containing protein [Shewanella sp. CAL98-MNA-CIBAN-0140]|uniref:MrcB family domain-containing protein n=1 Tax=Shewanella sp. CAL98-MNA-CIBAN-0140 TaxID=3140462 RepID=UPI00332FBDA9
MSLKLILEQIVNGWQQATTELFTGHPIATLIRHNLAHEIEGIIDPNDTELIVKSSAGAGNWASVPWLSILNPSLTTTTQSGIYPVFLFRADGTGIYLSLGFGTTQLSNDFGIAQARIKAGELRNRLRTFDTRLNDWNDLIDLRSNTPLGRSYEWASAGAKFYSSESIPNDQILYEDINEILSIYSKVVTLELDGEMIIERSTQTFLLSKPFLLLAGISGTGKTRFVREQAKITGNLTETYCLTPVRPDWHEPSDLLGYISRLSGQAEYVTTDVLQFMAKAWRAIVDAGLTVSAKSADEQGDVLTVSGDKAQLDGVLPYWLCLDEMNLAPVEQYFADYLSVIETREWCWHAESFTYQSDPLLKKNVIIQFDANGAPDLIYNAKLRSELGFVGAAYDDVWALFGQYGLGVPFNLIVAGTVNMDETTHGFSRKVIDRALSFDFGEFFPNDFDSFFAPTITHKTLSYPIYSHAKLDDLPVIDSDGNKTIGFLNEINRVLDNTPFKLAFRALNELLLAVITTQPTDELQLKAVWDDFLMCKVLPRIEGDSDKLASKNADRSLLEQLSILLQQEFTVFWNEDKNSVKARPDLYRENREGKDKVVGVACRSKAKIEWMETRLARSGFTSFWP